MNPNSNLQRIGSSAGLRYFVASLISYSVGFLTIFIFALSATKPVEPLILGWLVGAVVGGVLATDHLRKNNVPNYLLISILSMLFGLFIPAFGGLLMFPILTSLLGKQN